MCGADLTIVTNDELAVDVRSVGGRAFVLPDPLPDCPAIGVSPAPGLDYVVVISTFAPDEPLGEVLSAARAVPNLTFFVTGRIGERNAEVRAKAPINVHFTGFIEEPDYWSLLAHSCGVVDLTLMPDCLVCGAYEAMALRLPMVLSDNAPTRRLFGTSALLVQNQCESIRQALREIERGTAPRPTADDQRKFVKEWHVTADRLVSLLAASAA
jgi:glycosyltransferase involved in cell wall biosynthesis